MYFYTYNLLYFPPQGYSLLTFSVMHIWINWSVIDSHYADLPESSWHTKTEAIIIIDELYNSSLMSTTRYQYLICNQYRKLPLTLATLSLLGLRLKFSAQLPLLIHELIFPHPPPWPLWQFYGLLLHAHH